MFLLMIKNFFKHQIAELHNVTWPTKKQAVHAMITVIIVMLLVGLFLGILDYIFNEGVLFLLNR
jgi:preprotein translocase SecE subunit